MNCHFKFASKVVLIRNIVRSEEMASALVLDENGPVGHHWLPLDFESVVWIAAFQNPDCIEAIHVGHTHFLESGVLGVMQWTVRSRFEIQLPGPESGITLEFDGLPKMNNVVRVAVVGICPHNMENASGAGSSHVWA